MKVRQLLLLTACVNPNGMSYTVVQDYKVRLNQYLLGISFVLSHTTVPVLFVDNSGFDMSLIKSQFQPFVDEGRLEILSFMGNNYDKSLGKGYGEAVIIEYALQNSILMKKTDVVIKITGRLICKNINTILKLCNHNNTVIANVLTDKMRRCELRSQVFAAPPRFFNDFFIDNKYKLNDSRHYYFEHLLWEASLQWQKEGGFFKEFLFLPVIEGQSGSVGTIYKTSVYSCLVHPIKVMIHRIFSYYGTINPLFWVKKF